MYLPLNKFLRRFNMIGLLKKLFGAKPAEQTAEAPYKAETVSAPVVETAPMPVGIEAVIATPTVVVAESVVEQAPAKKPAPKKPQTVKKPAAPKTAQPKAAPKTKAKPVV
jgi:hypothetical protein